MSSYRKNWIQVLKDQNIPGWSIGEHGQAIVIKVDTNIDLEALKNEFPQKIDSLKEQVKEEKQWLKFILYNGENWFQYVIE